MNISENDMYEVLVREFEMNLKRNLTKDEKVFLEWLAKKHVEEKNDD